MSIRFHNCMNKRKRDDAVYLPRAGITQKRPVGKIFSGIGCCIFFSIFISSSFGDSADPVSIPDGEFMTVFCVAPDGNDLNPGTADEPFATLERARDAVRTVNGGGGMTGDILVAVAPGDYFLSKPFFLNANDSGRNGYQICYQGLGAPGSARLIGGKVLLNWEPAGGGLFRTKIESDHVFHTLYENGIRARKARFPNYEFDARFPLSGARYLASDNGTGSELIWKKGDLDFLSKVDAGAEANLVVWPWSYCDWHKNPRRIVEIIPERRMIRIENSEATFGRPSPAIGKEARYYIEGVRGLLDQPGEFHLDTDEGFLYYWPRFGDPSRQEIIAPVLERIVSIEGESAEQPVRAVIFDGFRMGFTDTFACMKGPVTFPYSIFSSGPHGTVHLRYTEEVEIRFNHIKGSGMNGIYFERSNKRNRIYGNWVEDSGFAGIVMAYHRESRAFPKDSNEDNRIENNLIHGHGYIAVDSAGVTLWGGKGNVIRHCEIFDGARYGVTIRGPYTQLRGSRPEEGIRHTNRPLTEETRVEYTHIYRVGQDCGDMGAVHMAGISSSSDHPVNYFEQLLIEDVLPHPSVRDVPPNGIFFDYTEGVTDQVLRNIEIRSTRSPFRTNRTNIRHTYDNCSWRNGFDPSQMKYDEIGLRKDFPENFRAPGEIRSLSIREDPDSGRKKEQLILEWHNPTDLDYAGVWITAEGEPGFTPVFVSGQQTSVRIDRPAAQRLVFLRLQSEDRSGNRSHGVLIPAAEEPRGLPKFQARGIRGGVQFSWEEPGNLVQAVQIEVLDADKKPIEIPANVGSIEVHGLRENQIYPVRINLLDTRGYIWPVGQIQIAVGEHPPVPTDTVAWWTLDAAEIREGLSISDESGNGNVLFIGHDSVQPAEGKFGGAFRFDGKSSYVRVLDATALEMRTDNYAVSFWMKYSPLNVMSGRVFDFGGGTRGRWEHWGQDQEPQDGFGGLSITANEYQMTAVMHDGSAQYSASAKGLNLTEEWHHVVVNICRNGRMTLWLNGKEIGSVDVSGSTGKDIRHKDTLFFGRQGRIDHPNLFWSGRLDQFRIYRRSLTVPEIIALYEEQ